MADGVADKIAFQLVAPERLLASAEVDMVVAPGVEGDFGVLPQHSLFMSVLRPGVIETYDGAQVSLRIFVAGGFAEVNPQGCTVLAEEAIPVAEIDLEHARRRLADAQDELRDAADDATRARCEREIRIAEAQIQAAGG
jgi:F-type H+-transporting ATPase subunit epsilon